jgi:non-homologous end joining protein Ku
MSEVRKEPELKAVAMLVADRNWGLAVKLIEALATKFEPEKFKDKYRKQVQALIAAKIQGREVATGNSSRYPRHQSWTSRRRSNRASRQPESQWLRRKRCRARPNLNGAQAPNK